MTVRGILRGIEADVPTSAEVKVLTVSQRLK
jgi:hypothetical protein